MSSCAAGVAPHTAPVAGGHSPSTQIVEAPAPPLPLGPDVGIGAAPKLTAPELNAASAATPTPIPSPTVTPAPPELKPYWVQNFKPTDVWSGAGPDAKSFGALPAWHFFHVVGAAVGNRLPVLVDWSSDAGYVEAGDVGPSGPPTKPVPGFTDIASGDRLGQLPGWPRIDAQSTTSQLLRPGVVLSWVSLLTSDGPLHLYQMTVDLTSPGIHLASVLSHNSVVSTGETVSSMANRTGALAGINGDYFAIGTSGVPLNLTVQNGNLIRSGNDWAVFAVKRNNQVAIDKYDWQGSLAMLRDPSLRFPIGAVNLPLMDQQVVAITQSMGSVLAANDATLSYLAAGTTPGQYTVRSVAQHQFSVPPVSGSDVVLAGEGVAATWLALYGPVGSAVQLDLHSQPSWQDLATAVGGGPIMLKGGLPYDDQHSPAAFESSQRYPVSGVGASRDGRTMWLVAVDGHEGFPAYGLTRPQFAWYFQTIGAWQAMAFDSGGSSTLVARLPGQKTATVINTPSDGRERPVADGLFLYG